MKIALGTIEVSDWQRRAIANYYGEIGLASRERCRSFIVRNGYESITDQEVVLEAETEREKD